MTASASDRDRYAPGGVTSDGSYRFDWNLTSRSLTDPVKLVLPPNRVLPVVFVPGIMGSNLMDLQGNPVWNLNTIGGQPLGLVKKMVFKSPGERQKLMHPARTKVDPSGHVPSKSVGSITSAKDYAERGWGEVGEGSYHGFLLWLEEHLNGQGYNPARWRDFYYTAVGATPAPGEAPPEPKLYPGIPMRMIGLPSCAEIGGVPVPVMSDDLLKRAGFRMPVYACGYNWLASNKEGGEALRDRINDIISRNNKGNSKCTQVILVTHSMGGLVARACQKLPGMREAIAGIVHGVMPTVGAAVAYRRCKIGMVDEDWKAGMAIGEDGPSVTAVFAQAPGALQLLPTTQYRPSWLTFAGPAGKKIATAQPGGSDPYADIYLQRNYWWGLVRKEWLHPRNGVPITWNIYKQNVLKAREFHEFIKNAFHPTTYVFYGKDSAQPSFEGIHWQVMPGIEPDNKAHPSLNQVPDLGFDQVRDSGVNPLHVGGGSRYQPSFSPYGGRGTAYETGYWNLQCAAQDGGGDGTVPTSSGAAPRHLGSSAIKQQFGLTGFAHEGAYRDSSTAKIVTLYAIQKISGMAKVSA